MLKLACELDRRIQLVMLVHDRVAVDLDSGVCLMRVPGHCLSGRKARYYLQRLWHEPFPRGRRRIGFAARTDAEAVEIANKELEKLAL